MYNTLLLALPRDLLCHIMAQVSVPDILSLGTVNRELHALSKVQLSRFDAWSMRCSSIAHTKRMQAGLLLPGRILEHFDGRRMRRCGSRLQYTSGARWLPY